MSNGHAMKKSDANRAQALQLPFSPQVQGGIVTCKADIKSWYMSSPVQLDYLQVNELAVHLAVQS